MSAHLGFCDFTCGITSSLWTSSSVMTPTSFTSKHFVYGHFHISYIMTILMISYLFLHQIISVRSYLGNFKHLIIWLWCNVHFTCWNFTPCIILGFSTQCHIQIYLQIMSVISYIVHICVFQYNTHEKQCTVVCKTVFCK